MIKLNKRLEQLMQELKKTSSETFYHSIRVKKLTMEMIDIANKNSVTKFKEEDVDLICKGALLHDLGKLNVPNYIMTKEKYLTDDEKTEIRAHTKKGLQAIENELTKDEYEVISNIVLYHHERIDGSGYACKNDLTFYVQIVSICDVFDALSSDRVYREGVSREKVMKMIKSGECGVFDERLVGFMEQVSENM